MLHDCVMKDSTQAELLIAGAPSLNEAAREGRDRLKQAVLRIDETFSCKADLSEMLDNESCKALISALGVGIGASLGLEALRYGRLILATDESPSGKHLRCEVLRFFFTYMRPVLEAGCVMLPEFAIRADFSKEDIEALVLRPETRRLTVVIPAESLEATLARWA